MSEHRGGWGGCHCGNLRLTLSLSQAPADTRLRACGCSFCRAHNTRTTSDPNGSVDIHAADWSLVQSYRFGTGTAEFLICKRCRVYIGAIGETASGYPRRHQHQLPGRPGRLHTAGRSRGSRRRGDRRPAGPTRCQLDASDSSPGITQGCWLRAQPSSHRGCRRSGPHSPGRVSVARFRLLDRPGHLAPVTYSGRSYPCLVSRRCHRPAAPRLN
jgi:hypothetical protein